MKYQYIKDRIKNYFINEGKKLDVKSFERGTGLFNFKCVDNSMQYKLPDPSAEIGNGDIKCVLCLCIDEYGSPFLHVINKESGKYIDNTLGYRYKDMDYYFVKDFPNYIESSDDARDFFNRYRRYLIKKYQSKIDLRTIDNYSDVI